MSGLFNLLLANTNKNTFVLHVICNIMFIIYMHTRIYNMLIYKHIQQVY